MNTSHARLQPQDPFAAKLGTYVVRAGVLLVIVLAATSLLRG